MFAG
ncbi:hypothetical protein ECEC4013_1906, partial [Escherichia coli EC4013]|jgi:hypothetical protein